MRRLLPFLLIALVGCVEVTTRATVTVGAGGRAELAFGGREGEPFRLANTGTAPVDVRIGRDETLRLEPGRTILLKWPADARLEVVNLTDREAALVVELGAAVEK